jgi:dolichyl-phosphate beta-glucosyltransferase
LIALSVVIPCFEEERRLGPTLEAWLAFLSEAQLDGEILVVDDGSRDRTAAIARRVLGADSPHRILRSPPPNHGKGWAVRTGMLAARGERALFSDADLSTPVGESARLFEALDRGHDVAIGSRWAKGAAIGVHQPWAREQLGRMLNAAVRAVALPEYRDTQCGFKCFSRRASEAVFSRLTLDGFAFDVEALFIAKRLGLRIAEVPVAWNNDLHSRVRPLVDGPRMLQDLARVRLRHRATR